MKNAKTYTKYGTITCSNSMITLDLVEFLNSKGYSTLVEGNKLSESIITYFNDDTSYK